jgi:hypothetical protein
MLKIFLNLLGVTRTQIRILGSGSVKKNSSKQKMQMIPDLDVVRIHESYQTECECIWIRILESGFRNFYADPKLASGSNHTERTPSSGSDWARTSLVCKGYSASKASVRTRECYALKPDHTIQVRWSQTYGHHVLPLPSYGKPPWTHPEWKIIRFSLVREFGTFSQDD